MGLIERIKSALGLDTSASSPSRPGRTERPTRTEEADTGGAPASATEEQGESTAGGVESQATDEVDVTVEHDPETPSEGAATPSTESEDAVKGTDTAETTDAEPGEAEREAAETADAEPADAEPADAEPADTGTAGAETAEGDVEDAEAEEAAVDEAEPDEADTGEIEADLEDIKGIGPTYAERLHEAGIGDVAALADADAADLSDRTDIAESRVQNWIDRAGTY